MSYRLLQFTVLLALLATCCQSIRITPELEKCAEQLLHMLAAEPNPVFKDAIIKIVKYTKEGALADAQKTLLTIPEPDRSTATKKYLLGECIPMAACLECPVEL